MSTGVRDLDGRPDGPRRKCPAGSAARPLLFWDAAEVGMPAGNRPHSPCVDVPWPGPRPRELVQSVPYKLRVRGGYRNVRPASALVAGVQEATRHLSGPQTAVDTSLATCRTPVRPDGGRFRKQRTVNPPIARNDFLYSPSRPACGRHAAARRGA